MPKMLARSTLGSFLLIAGSLCASARLAADGPGLQDLTDAHWQIASRGGHRVEDGEGGRQVLVLRNGRAERSDLELEDGTIEFDLWLAERRAFVGVQFRQQASGDAEHFYFRPHKSALPDALQYTPVLANLSQWQLFHDESGGAAVTLPENEWVRVRIVFAGRRAAVFYGSMERPVLTVARLALEPTPGGVRLTSGAPGLAEDEADYARFANLVIRPGWIPYEFPAPAETEAASGLVTSWSLGPAFVATEEPITGLPANATSGPWTAAPTEPGGLLMISRYLERPEGAEWWGTFARLELETDVARSVALEVGFSDNATLFLNGEPLFSGRYSYSYELPARLGLITLDQATVYLPLEVGRNELLVAVTETFGGWALIGRLLGADGVTVRAPW